MTTLSPRRFSYPSPAARRACATGIASGSERPDPADALVHGWMGFVLALILGFALALHTLDARAGQTCSEKELPPAEVRAALTLAIDLSHELDIEHAEVALVARVGQDLSRYGLRYSHVGIARRDPANGTWTMIEELNECGTAHSTLYADGFGNFFLDDMFAYEAKIVVPSPDMQRQIAATLASGAAIRLHEPRYSEIAYPWSTRYQNCNQWVLETLAEALDPQHVTNRADAQSWLRAKGYHPKTLNVSPLEQFGAQLFATNIAFDDHPQDRLTAGEIDVVTAESVMDFVTRIDGAASVRVLSVDPTAPARPATPTTPRAAPAPQGTAPSPLRGTPIAPPSIPPERPLLHRQTRA